MSVPTTVISYGADYSLPQPVSEICPIPFGPKHDSYYITQAYRQFAKSWTPPVLNSIYRTERTELTHYYLVEETGHHNVAAGIIEFTRTYAPIFPTQYNYEDYAWTLPGLAGALNTTLGCSGPRRQVMTPSVVVSELRSVFFLLGVSRTDVYETASSVVQTERQIPILYPLPIIGSNGVTWDFYDVNASTQTDSTMLIGGKGWCYPDAFKNGSNYYTLLEGPAAAAGTYAAKAASAGADHWIVAEASKIRRWKGNLIERITRYVEAQ